MLKKKILTAILSVIMLLNLITPALAAQTSSAASVLRLEAVTGTATMKNASGKKVSTSQGTRLYSGYQLNTNKKSYAYISLDSNKAIKLDASTKSKVNKSGKKLEVRVTSGKMFFNVSVPVKSNESLNIRTSTMVTGIRGTSGWVTVIDKNTTQISLLEGKLEVISINENEMRSTQIEGGQTMTIVYNGENSDTSPDDTIQELIQSDIIKEENIIATDTGLRVEELQEEDVPAFVAVEVEKDTELQNKIEQTTDLSVPEIIEDAEEKLAEDEQKAEQADNIIQDKVEQIHADTEVNPVFEDTSDNSSGSSGGGSSGGVTTYTLTVNWFDMEGQELAPTQTQTLNEGTTYTAEQKTFPDYKLSYVEGQPIGTINENTTVTFVYEEYYLLTNPTVDEIVQAFNTNDVVNVEQANFNLSNAFDIPVDKTLSVNSGTINNNNDITINGTLTIEDSATLENSGNINIDSINSLHIKNGGILTNNNSANIYVGNSADGVLYVESGGTLNNLGAISVGNGAYGSLYIESGGTLNNDNLHIMIGNGSDGSLYISSGGILNNNSEIYVGTGMDNNNATLTNDGILTNSYNLFIMQNGKFTLNGELNNTSQIENADATIKVAGTMTANSGSIINNNAYLYFYKGSNTTLNDTINNNYVMELGVAEMNPTALADQTEQPEVPQNTESFILNGTLYNNVFDGEGVGLTIHIDTILDLYGKIQNKNTIENNGTINFSGGTLTNDGTIDQTDTGTLTGSSGTLDNTNGTFTNANTAFDENNVEFEFIPSNSDNQGENT